MRVAILNSRQSLRPCGGDAWIKKTIETVRWIKQNNFTLISSTGMSTWELVTALASIEQVPLELYLVQDPKQSQSEQTEHILSQFGLAMRMVTCIQVSATASDGKSEILHARDMAILSAAGILVPISIRPEGNLSSLITQAKAGGKQIVQDFETTHKKPDEQYSYMLDRQTLTSSICNCKYDYIIHWTRATHGRWPNERSLDYYRDIISSIKYPRGAFDTLCRILEQRKILGSAWRMPGKIATASFSDLAPSEAISLMRWRARFSQMSFEPYGIGIRKEYAQRLGIEPVVYYDSSDKSSVGGIEPWQTQSIGQVTDWRNEHEYRMRGDCDLSTVPAEQMCVFTRFAKEAVSVRKKFGFEAVSFLD